MILQSERAAFLKQIMKLSNNTLLITGGATGIGFAIAEEFVKKGNEVIICGRRENKLQEAKKKTAGNTYKSVRCFKTKKAGRIVPMGNL